jgi:phospholipid/cholesterol/gamma-HCH transport system ATP-binding protein
VRRGEVLGIVGASGSGKSVLLKTIVMLLRPAAGAIRLFGYALDAINLGLADELRERFGVMFQNGALFNSLSVLENVMMPLREHTGLRPETMRDLAVLKLALVGLEQEAAGKYPSQLSGGMIKRVAVARALALDPELLFLDEPTAGLDPVAAAAIDEMILRLGRELDLTIVMVTHDLDSLWRTTDRVAFLGERRTLAVEPIAELARNPHPAIAEFFGGERARRFTRP